jgi:regulator of sigma E protease
VPIVFRVARDGGESDVTVVPEASEQGGRRVGLAGLRLKVDPESVQRIAITVRSGPLDALGQGARRTWELSTFTLRMLGRMVTGDASLKNLSGPMALLAVLMTLALVNDVSRLF